MTQTIQGTQNILKTAYKFKVKHVVVTGTIGS